MSRLFVLLSVLPCVLRAGDSHEQPVLDLAHDGVVMNIAAHPDDEDGATLAYYRMKYGATTYSVLFTRGEGGQNEIGPELYSDLAVIRTVETKKAGVILGARVFFLNFDDFGYSRSSAETFRAWGGELEPLRRMVYLLRKLKPDIIFTNHTPGTGHGHHQAVGVTVLSAFNAAGDPAMFPEQLGAGGLDLWQPRKLFVRIFDPSTSQYDVAIRIGELHQPSGFTYLEIASKALAQHKSQGMDQPDSRRTTREFNRYRLAGTDSAYAQDTTDFFGGIAFYGDPRMSDLRQIRRSLDGIINETPSRSLVGTMSPIMETIAKVKQDSPDPLAARILGQWKEELEQIVTLSCSVRLTASAHDSILVRDQETEIIGNAVSDVSDVRVLGTTIAAPEGWGTETFTGTEKIEEREEGLLIGGIAPSQSVPFTLPRVHAQYNPVETETDVFLLFQTTIDGWPVTVRKPLVIDVAPEAELSVQPPVAWFSQEDVEEEQAFKYRVINRMPQGATGKITVELPSNWQAGEAGYVCDQEDQAFDGTVLIKAPANTPPGLYPIRFTLGNSNVRVEARVFSRPLVSSVHLGVVGSYDNTIPWAAEALGVRYELLGPGDLRPENLSRFQSIVIDIRAYAMRHDLKTSSGDLLEYVRKGGNLIVMYQKTQDWKPEYAPYPFSVTRKRVTEEDAPVTVLAVDHPLMNLPNRITREDWDAWVQERGVYFPEDASPEYERLLSTGDSGEDPLDTGYLVAQAGTGSYIYTSLVWYRQLKERHEGALKCFANMISYYAHRR